MAHGPMQDFLQSPGVRVWRYSKFERVVLCVYLGGTMLAIAVELAFVEGLPVAGLVIISITVAFLYWVYFRPLIAASDQELLIVNFAGPRRVALSDVRTIDPTWSGLRLGLADGKVVRAWAVQQWNAARWFGRRSRVDEVSDCVWSHIGCL